MQGFRVPAALHEGLRQPIQQLRVRGQFALRAKILFGGDEAAPKMRAPKSVYRDARGERIAAVHHPSGQTETVGRKVLGKREYFFRSARSHRLAGRVVSTALKHERGPPR